MSVSPVHDHLRLEREFRRAALLVILGAVAAASVVTLAGSTWWGFAGWEQAGLAAIAAKNLALFAWLRRFPGALRAVGLTELALEVTGGVLKFAGVLFLDRAASGLGGYVFWLPVVYIVAFLVLPPARALAVSAGMYAALAALAAAFGLSPAVALAARLAQASPLLQMLLMHATFVACLGLLASLLDRFVRSVVRVDREVRLARLDELTELPNRRQLLAWLRAEHEEGAQPLSVVLFDVDHFKGVNDTFGHAVGDEVLREIAARAGAGLPEGARLGRWGGEEFLVLLPGAGLPAARHAARGLREAVGGAEIGPAGRVTVSCGVAEARPGETVGELMNRADRALYAAKEAGRDRVVAATAE